MACKGNDSPGEHFAHTFILQTLNFGRGKPGSELGK